jgi:hypothetical protein
MNRVFIDRWTSGQAAANIKGVIDKRGNIFEGACAREYPMPALAGSKFIERMAAATRNDRGEHHPEGAGGRALGSLGQHLRVLPQRAREIGPH